MRNTYLKELYRLAGEDKNVLSLIADNGMIVYDEFRRDYPEQYINFGISEGHMITAAAGMASCGKIPFAYTIGAFLAYRSCEFLRLDVCLQKQNVKIVGIGAGVTYGYLGPTHHSTEDIAILRAMPNMTLFSPGTAKETKAIVDYAYHYNGPVYIRLGNNLPKELYGERQDVIIGQPTVLREGKDATVFATGEILNETYEAAEMLAKEGIEIRVLSVHTLKPWKEESIIQEIKSASRVISIEEHSIVGGLGGAIAETIADNGIGKKLNRIGFNDSFAKGYGNRRQVLMQNELDSQGIYKKIKEIIVRGE